MVRLTKERSILRVKDMVEACFLPPMVMSRFVIGQTMLSLRASQVLLTVAHSEATVFKASPMDDPVLTTLKVFNTSSTMVI
jgi:hypothetical protein